MASKKAGSYLSLSRLATTNNPPSTQDAALIREMVDGLDHRADEIKAQLQELEQELQGVERDRKFFQPMLSPLRRMPLEVLGEIFVRLVSIDRRHRALAAICTVCKAWRDAASLVPRLWTKVSLNPSSSALLYGGVSAWLSRAGGLPRTVQVDYPQCDAPFDKGVYVGPRCLGQGRCGLSKTELAKILRDTPFLDRVFIQPPTHECLTRLVLNLATSPDERPWTGITHFAVELKWDFVFPSQSTLTFGDHLIPPSATSLELMIPDFEDRFSDSLSFDVSRSVLRRLRSFSLACDWPAEHIYKLLRHCNNIETLELDLGFATFEWSSNHGPLFPAIQHGILLSSLKSLRLNNVQVDIVIKLQYLQMPALTELCVRFDSESWLPPREPFTAFDTALGTSFSAFLHGNAGISFTLETLRITNGDFEDDSLFAALQGLSDLKHLAVDNASFKPDVFAKCSSRDALPRLQTLELLRLHINPEQLSGLQAFVAKRGAPLTASRCESEFCPVCTGAA